MSMQAVVEIALHFESFRNIDLFHQGLYHLRARIRHDLGAGTSSPAGSPGAGSVAGAVAGGGQPQAPIAAAPCGALSLDPVAAATAAAAAAADGDETASVAKIATEGSKAGSKQAARADHHNLIPAHSIDDQATYSTRSFLIRYCEEEVELNDIGQFRWEVSQEELDTGSCPSLILEVDLMFADLGQHGGADRFGESPDVDSTEFKCVSTARFRLRSAARGMHEYVSVIFDEYHCCLASCTVHSILLDYRFRLQPSLLSTGAGGNSSGDADDAAAEASSIAGSAQMPQLRAVGVRPASLSVEECLFGIDAAMDSHEQLLKRTEALYEKYFDALVASHSQITAWFKQIGEDCLLPLQREALDALRSEPAGCEEAAAVPEPASKSPPGSGDSLSTQSTDARRQAGARGTQRQQEIESRLGARATPRAAASLLTHDLSAASCRVAETWHTSLSVLLHAPREATLWLRRSWEVDTGRRWAASIVKDPPRADLAVTEVEDSCGAHSSQSEALRRGVAERDRGIEEELAVQDISGIFSMDARPLIFDERYLGGGCGPSSASSAVAAEEEPMDSPPSAPKRYLGVHLIVLVHGFQGNSFDMRLMKNTLAMLYPDSIFLSSTCNEDNTEGDINEMGVRLAQEVVNYVCDWCPSGALGRLSFITHSLGGLIARAALPLLQEYSAKMFTFLSLSSCHLGVFQDKISLFNTGFWVLKKWRQSTFLQQVSMGDHDNPRETFLYKLSKSKGLEHFRHIVLTSCYEDQYGQLQSARAEVCPEWAGQADKAIYKEMVGNIWAAVRPDQVMRLDMNFVIAEKNLDAFIGRTAHIQFLECQQMMRMLVHNYSALFR